MAPHNDFSMFRKIGPMFVIYETPTSSESPNKFRLVLGPHRKMLLTNLLALLSLWLDSCQCAT